MSEQQPAESNAETTEPQAPTPDTPEAPEEDADEPDTFPRAYVEDLRRENAEHRVKAKRGDTLARRLVLAYAQGLGKLADPTDLPYDDALCDDDGLPDPAKIADAVDELISRKPHLADRRPRGDVGQGATTEAGNVDLAGLLRRNAG